MIFLTLYVIFLCVLVGNNALEGDVWALALSVSPSLL